MAVRTERTGPVTTIILDRPGVRNAVDRPIAAELVDAAEALAMGLVDRVVPAGRARAEAEALAARLATFPQTCLRQDRLSALGQEARTEVEAMHREFERGLYSVASDALPGAARFAAGEGRHGSFR